MSHDKETIWTGLAPGQPIRGVIYVGLDDNNKIKSLGSPENKILLQQALEKKHLVIDAVDGHDVLSMMTDTKHSKIEIYPGSLIIFNQKDVTVVMNPQTEDNFYFPFAE